MERPRPFHMPYRYPPADKAAARASYISVVRHGQCFFVGNAANGTYCYLYVPVDGRVFQGEGRAHRTEF